MLEQLKIPGKKVSCENYKCNTHFVESDKYFHHASICKPLYRCEACENEFTDKRQYNDHVCMQQNTGTDKREKVSFVVLFIVIEKNFVTRSYQICSATFVGSLYGWGKSTVKWSLQLDQ